MADTGVILAFNSRTVEMVGGVTDELKVTRIKQFLSVLY